MEDLYFIAILPPAGLSERIDEIRKEVSLDHGVFSALKPPVHLTLVPPFKLRPANEQQLIQKLKSLCHFEPFIQKLEDFDGFPEHTVFIRALKNTGISALYKNLKAGMKPYVEGSKNPFNPHLTIAYRDAKEAYPQIMEQYQNRRFREEFLADHFTLLKHDGKRWNLHSEYYAQPSITQLEMGL
ncbi:2'-5' RNA ligase family protein [Pedobacter caeni]|uniref:2'-5' RNA ligase n=1 Tax=Pedobacter caeni TaxID=288992 RepID=A0A1M5E5S0_9SPHI|nr:2'-5' RNA ligase family protein [Pedobacter caeni]SHF74494.1 2'-5' RNA ligase [Pedobacter caeni]